MILLGLLALLLIAVIPRLCCSLEERGHFLAAMALEWFGAGVLGSVFAAILWRVFL